MIIVWGEPIRSRNGTKGEQILMVRGYSHNTRMRNKFCSLSISYYFHTTNSPYSRFFKFSCLSRQITLKAISIRHLPQTTRWQFPSRNETEWNVIQGEREFHLDWRPELTHFGITCTKAKFLLSASYKQVQGNHIWRWNGLAPEKK